MNKIGFKNFRRFQNFEPITYKGITFLVGRNNAGKSTLVKALLLGMDYMKSDGFRIFQFGNHILDDANIVTYGRAKNKFAMVNSIQFFYVIDDFEVTIAITGEEDKTIAQVLSIQIKHLKTETSFKVEPINRTISVFNEELKLKDSNEHLNVLSGIDLEIAKLQGELSVYEDNKYSRDYIIILDRVQSLIERKKEILKSIEEPNKDIFTFSDFYSETEDNATLKDLIIQFIEHQRNKYAHSYDKIQNDKKVDYNDFEKIKYFKDNYVRMINIINSFYEIIKKKTIVYLGAGTARQSALFSIRDKNNALAQAIHDFYQLRIQPGEEANLFVKEWMSNFEIGEQYEIELHAGEAYEVNIRSQSKRIPMADMGMGSIQAMLLIIRLATIIHNSKKSNKTYTVVIEEPELNLHPALQSQLASMFHHVHEKYRINLIVETHSEYLIRKTQLIVKQMEYEIAPNENPFAVIYFDKDLKQWSMNYRADGVFKDDFGPGFFDVSSQQAINLFKKQG
jgi:predicted ATPase